MTIATAAADETRTCETTGLRLWRSQSQSAYRVAATSYGPLNPLVRDGEWAPNDVMAWGRWDSAPGRTIYASLTRQGAYLEALSHYGESPTLAKMPMSSAFPEDHATNPKSVMDQIKDEIAADWGGWGPGKVTAGWRTSRSVYTLQLPADGWFIDIAHSDSIAALRKVDGPLDGPLATTRPDLSNLTGPVRPWTIALATKLRGLVLDDGTLPHGIKYLSTHGAEHPCIAYWMRAMDDGKELSSEPIREISTVPIHCYDDPDYKKALGQLSLTSF